ncbi:lytic murein transglycosylase [Tranquillimonas rosea]|uniref:Lytic murein transglycosylase n=1 Tax=Tranquillimonas rosea TaxID=641238 RepID=A0A1H9U8W7_9RHOB|nr:lytic murein transglycosylase [Tranquillimonas rosea]
MRSIRALTLVSLMVTTAAPALAQAPDASPRPAARGEQAAPAVSDVSEVSPEPAPEDGNMRLSTMNLDFRRWIDTFRGRALAQGVDPDTFDQSFEGVQYNTDVIQRDRNQSEFTKTIWEYLDSAVSESRVENGRAALDEYADTLDAIEARYGVEKEVVAAIWGLESAYGSYRGDTPIIEALATLAHDGRRGRFFEAQLVAALKIVQNGDTAPGNMTGSWAGAMGHTQFIPTSYLTYAVDFTGDGKRNVWSEDPTDALASTAAYLARFGWETGQPWGVEVQVPDSFDYTLASRDVTRQPSEWAEMGIVGMDGQPVEDHGEASVLLPAGAEGAAFLIFDNFGVIERYNTADAYVIGVGHLSDRLAGDGPLKAEWPRDDRSLTFAERKEMQRRLTEEGFDTKGVDGKVGPLTIRAIRGFQRSAGFVPDGYASLTLLDRLR